MKIAATLALRAATLLSLSLLFPACGPSTDGPSGETNGSNPDQTEETFFELAAEKEPYTGEIDEDTVAALSLANTETAFRFYQLLRTQDANLIYSPLSFSRVFAGYYDGEREADAFEAVFGFTPEVATIDAWKQLFHVATDRSDVEPDDPSQFTSQDVYWEDDSRGGSADPAAFDRVHVFDIQSDPEAARQLINGWVEEESYGMLKDFLPTGSINKDTEAVATNLVYFLGGWGLDFKDAENVEFQGLEGAVDMKAFSGAAQMRALQNAELTAVRIPYTASYSHWVLMPASNFDEFAANLTAEQFQEIRRATTDVDVTLTMPEFTANSEPDMVGAIETIRIRTGTEGDTLSGAYMETFFHKAAIEISKEGTKAAAVSAVVEYGNNGSEPLERLEVTVDRPFVHFIMDDESGSILFMGQLTAP